MKIRTLALACAFSLAATGCTPWTVTTITNYQIEQTTLVPRANAPQANGAMPRAGEMYAEGAIQGGPVVEVEGDARRLNGHVTPLAQLRGRFAGSPTEGLEFGGSMRYATALLGAQPSQRERPPELSQQHTIGFGGQLRVMPYRTEYVGVAFGVEGNLDVIPHTRTVYSQTTEIINTPGPDSVFEYPIQESNSTQSRTLFTGNAHIAIHAMPIPGLELDTGLSVANHPRFFGIRNTAEICESNGFDSSCVGDDPDDIPHYTDEMLTTLFMGAMIDVDEGLSIGARGWWHAAGPNSIRNAEPVGGEVSLRFWLH